MSNNKTGIYCCVYSSRENEKGLTVEASGEEDVVHGGVPIISSTAALHTVGIDENGVYRVNGNNERTPLAKSAEEARKMIKRKGIMPKTNERERD